MQLRREARAIACVVLFTYMMGGCAVEPDAKVSMPSPAPAVTTPAPVTAPDAAAIETDVPVQTAYDAGQHIDADAVKWLEERINADVAQQELSEDEAAMLNDLAYRVDHIEPYFSADELEKRDFTFILYNYYQQAEYRELPTPPDGMGDPLGYGTVLYLSSEKASALLREIIGADIPDADADYQDNGYGDTICKDGVYYIFLGDLEHAVYTLGAYQYLGDDMFYVSFDADDTYLAGPEDEKKGVVPDAYRLLVKRSDSQWGFTVLSKFKDMFSSILPEDFPSPGKQ